MSVLTSMHQITLGDRNGVFILSKYEAGKKFSITLIDVDQNEAFTGKVTDIELRSQAANIRMSYNDFVSITTKALTQDKYDDLQFLYSLEKNCDNHVFKWKSVDSNETTITLGIMNLNENNYGCIMKHNLLLLLEEQKNLHHKLLLLEDDLKIAEKEKAKTFHILDEAKRIKESFENELYAKFVLVLNEKKRKIRELSEDTFCKEAKKKKTLKNLPGNTSRNKLHQVSESSDEGDNYLNEKYEPGPSKAKQNCSLLFDDEDEPKLLASPNKIRKRKVFNATASKNSVQETKVRIFSDTESEDELLLNL